MMTLFTNGVLVDNLVFTLTEIQKERRVCSESNDCGETEVEHHGMGPTVLAQEVSSFQFLALSWFSIWHCACWNMNQQASHCRGARCSAFQAVPAAQESLVMMWAFMVSLGAGNRETLLWGHRVWLLSPLPNGLDLISSQGG